jgi:4,5-DOPA dioxygenase extradiol
MTPAIDDRTADFGGRMPALFIGHGSPMNIIADNAYTRDLAELAAALPRPRAVLVVSAHWLTRGTAVGADDVNLTIYDFYGFPEELYRKRYPAPGAPDVAQRVRELTGGRAVPQERGIDHAAWSPLIRMYPAHDVPVLEMSLDMTIPAAEHYALGRRLAPLRDEGVLMIGSGNIVHSFQEIDWDENAAPAPWAVEFDQWVAQAVADRRHQDLVDYLDHPLGRRAAPTPDHYYPLLYTLALQDEGETVATTHASIQHASMSMRCLRIR